MLIKSAVLKKFLLLTLLVIPLFFLFAFLNKVSAQCTVSDRNQGLVSSAGGITGNFGNSIGTCVTDSKAAYAPFKVPTYNDLKSIHYDQAKQPVAEVAKLPITGNYDVSDANRGNINKHHLIHTTGNMSWAGTNPFYYNPGSGETTPIYNAVIFIEGNLTINSNINYNSQIAGLVFIVKNDVFINPAVTTINAMIVSEGAIYTAYDVSDGNATNSVTGVQPLIVNGSLISIYGGSDTTKRIVFNRSLSDNSRPAEVVNFQPKYLVILRKLLTQSFSIQREISPDTIPANLPSPTALPSVAPSNNPGSSLSNPLKIFTIFSLLDKIRI